MYNAVQFLKLLLYC